VSEDRVARIEAILREAFSPSHLLVKDQSHLHAGHAGAQDGRGHYDVRIVSEAFAGKLPLARHRMIYDALGTMMETDIHALRIDARDPSNEN
jgi:BolA protein